MNEPPQYLNKIGELLFRYGGVLLIVFGCIVALLRRKHGSAFPHDGTNFMLMGAASMIYSRLCQIARQSRP